MQAAATQPYVAMLGTLDWSVATLRQQLALPSLAAREATAVIAAMHGIAAPGRLSTSPALARVALRALPLLAPFDLPRYLHRHFGKLSEQTDRMIDGWIAEGRARSQPVAGLEALGARTRANAPEAEQPGVCG